MGPKPEVIYVGDPMCSWCWGIAPVIDGIAKRSDVSVRVVVGGLRPGPAAQQLDESLRDLLLHHWDQVSAKTGQPFNPAGLDRDNWVYDTELPARAVVTMRHLAPQLALPFFGRVQRAFYADAVDVTDPDAYPPLLDGFDVDKSEFMSGLIADESRRAAWDDFAEARELGVAGFPTVLLQFNGGIQVLSRGYAGADYFDSALAHWVGGTQPAAADGACALDAPC